MRIWQENFAFTFNPSASHKVQCPAIYPIQTLKIARSTQNPKIPKSIPESWNPKLREPVGSFRRVSSRARTRLPHSSDRRNRRVGNTTGDCNLDQFDRLRNKWMLQIGEAPTSVERNTGCRPSRKGGTIPWRSNESTSDGGKCSIN